MSLSALLGGAKKIYDSNKSAIAGSLPAAKFLVHELPFEENPLAEPQLYEIDLVLAASSPTARDEVAFATVLMPVIPRIGHEIYFEGMDEKARYSGTYRVTNVAYHVHAHKKQSKLKLKRTVTGLTGDLFGISLTVTKA
jgi:hypothetical protein